MAVSSIKAVFSCDIRKVWEVVTDVENYAWRSDLGRTEILNDRQFVEYTKDGYATTFTITVAQPCKRWEFDMENGNMKGHWTGVFIQRGKETEIEFTEDVTVKKLFMKPFVKTFLKKQQEQFISDLKKRIADI
ncbi:MAG: SRPBCC family protein [Blautia sp.]|nr:SRPBCC family protein [Blautia sp.]